MAGYYSGLGTPRSSSARLPTSRGIYDTLGRMVLAWKAERGDEPFKVGYEGAIYEAYLVGADGVPFRKLAP